MEQMKKNEKNKWKENSRWFTIDVYKYCFHLIFFNDFNIEAGSLPVWNMSLFVILPIGFKPGSVQGPGSGFWPGHLGHFF
jgi:hypothetical protein